MRKVAGSQPAGSMPRPGPTTGPGYELTLGHDGLEFGEWWKLRPSLGYARVHLGTSKGPLIS